MDIWGLDWRHRISKWIDFQVKNLCYELKARNCTGKNFLYCQLFHCINLQGNHHINPINLFEGLLIVRYPLENFHMLFFFSGWDKQSYGYHGDDGNSFSSSGAGKPYGPTFTTGDIIGCGVNLVDNTCFYTKNGHHLGIAFRDLPAKLYPTVGLQTPGEVVDANFGQEPFKFDIEDMHKELRAATKASIYSFPLPVDQGDWTTILHE